MGLHVPSDEVAFYIILLLWLLATTNLTCRAYYTARDNYVASNRPAILQFTCAIVSGLMFIINLGQVGGV